MRLSVCLANAASVSKGIDMSSHYLDNLAGGIILVFWAPAQLQNFKGTLSAVQAPCFQKRFGITYVPALSDAR